MPGKEQTGDWKQSLYSPLPHSHNQVQSKASPRSGRSNGGPQGRGAWHFSEARCVLPWCGFAIKKQERRQLSWLPVVLKPYGIWEPYGPYPAPKIKVLPLPPPPQLCFISVPSSYPHGTNKSMLTACTVNVDTHFSHQMVQLHYQDCLVIGIYV